MKPLAGIPVFIVLTMLQTAVFSRLTLLHGAADVVLLAVIAWSLQENTSDTWVWGVLAGLAISLVSAVPALAVFTAYLGAVLIARVLHSRVWKTPILAMFLTTFLSTLLLHGVSAGVLFLRGVSVPVADLVNLVTLPSALLNLMLAIPVFAFIRELAEWLYPVEYPV